MEDTQHVYTPQKRGKLGRIKKYSERDRIFNAQFYYLDIYSRKKKLFMYPFLSDIIYLFRRNEEKIQSDFIRKPVL
jgi:hypothetical protein